MKREITGFQTQKIRSMREVSRFVRESGVR